MLGKYNVIDNAARYWLQKLSLSFYSFLSHHTYIPHKGGTEPELCYEQQVLAY